MDKKNCLMGLLLAPLLLIAATIAHDLIEVACSYDKGNNPEKNDKARTQSVANSDMHQLSNGHYIVITDIEPDDRIALHILAARIPKDEILFVGSTVMHAARKKALIRQLLDQLGLNEVPVFQGTGGTAESYEDIASSRAAREYAQEGAHILSDDELEQITTAPRSSDELQTRIEKALDDFGDIEFIVLAPPTDLVKVLVKKPHLRKKIKHIYLMGGWIETPGSVLRTTYNWNMDPIASEQLMDMHDIPMTIFSSHAIKNSFNGGSINSDNYPRIFDQIDILKEALPSFADQETASLSWNTHIIEKIPFLRMIIGPYKEKQFTPADPLVVVGLINKSLIKNAVPATIKIDVNDKDKSKGFRVYVATDASSKTAIVDSIDTAVFEEEILASFSMLGKQRII